MHEVQLLDMIDSAVTDIDTLSYILQDLSEDFFNTCTADVLMDGLHSIRTGNADDMAKTAVFRAAYDFDRYAAKFRIVENYIIKVENTLKTAQDEAAKKRKPLTSTPD